MSVTTLFKELYSALLLMVHFGVKIHHCTSSVFDIYCVIVVLSPKLSSVKSQLQNPQLRNQSLSSNSVKFVPNIPINSVLKKYYIWK